MTRGTLLTILVTALVAGGACKQDAAPQPAARAAPQPAARAAPVAQPAAASAAAAAQPAAAAPQMPAGWKVSSDTAVLPAVVKQIASRLGGELAALRNTVYEVDGKRVQVNTMRAADGDSAAKIVATLRRMKDQRFVVSAGLTIYEFVGQDDAIPAMEAGRRHLEGRR